MIRHQRLVLNVAHRLLGSKEDAKDIAQEVFLRLHRSLGSLREDRQLAPWLYRVTVNACHDLRRRERRWVALEGDYSSPAMNAESGLQASQQRRLLAEGLEQLPEKERAAVLLRDIQGLSTAEVAAILDSSEATVRSQISVARGKLRKFVGRVWGRR
jgi:RNA polymerase sigma-70 factor (ECF subfamily)